MSDPAGQVENRRRSTGWFRREWRLFLGLAITAICLFLAVRKLSLPALRDAITTARWEWVVLAMAVILASSFLKAVRWRLLFLPQRIPLGKAWSVLMIGQMLNATLPARAGEVGRVYLIGEEDEISRSAALATVITEKAIDVVMLTLAFLIVALGLAASHTGLPEWLQDAGKGLIPLTLLALASLLLLARLGARVWSFVRRRLEPLPTHWLEKGDATVDQALTALTVLYRGRARTQVLGWSFLIWVLMALTNSLVFNAFGLGPRPLVALLLLVVLMSSVVVTPSPASLGVFVYLCILVLSLFDVNHETALLYGVTLQIVVYLPQITLGAACMVWENWSSKR